MQATENMSSSSSRGYTRTQEEVNSNSRAATRTQSLTWTLASSRVMGSLGVVGSESKLNRRETDGSEDDGASEDPTPAALNPVPVGFAPRSPLRRRAGSVGVSMGTTSKGISRWNSRRGTGFVPTAKRSKWLRFVLRRSRLSLLQQCSFSLLLRTWIRFPSKAYSCKV